MPPKDQKPSKKTVQAKQAKVIEDSTFGLKNKNKSKKVQEYITRVEKTVKHSQGDAEKAREAKKDAKIAKQLQEEELRVLFNEGIANQFGKKKTAAASTAEALGIAGPSKDVEALLADFSSDSDSESDESEDGVYRRELGPEWEDNNNNSSSNVGSGEIEIFREKTIEDIIEEQRAKLAAEGKQGTPVTAESFARWRAGKLAQKQAAAEARMKAEQTKRKGGKGLSILSGKELFNYNASLFVDDTDAIDAAEEQSFVANQAAQEQAEEEAARQEAERAQKEQQRLLEIQLAEDAANQARDEERRVKAAAADRIEFVLAGVVINEIVFDVAEAEDLELFPEYIETLVEAEPVSQATAVGVMESWPEAAGEEEDDDEAGAGAGAEEEEGDS